jgi:hypothetical protein
MIRCLKNEEGAFGEGYVAVTLKSPRRPNRDKKCQMK